MADFDVHSVRVLLRLGKAGRLSRWVITQRVLAHLSGEERKRIIDRLVKDGYLAAFSEHNTQERRRGPAPLIYELTTNGRRVYQQMMKAGVVRIPKK